MRAATARLLRGAHCLHRLAKHRGHCVQNHSTKDIVIRNVTAVYSEAAGCAIGSESERSNHVPGPPILLATLCEPPRSDGLHQPYWFKPAFNPNLKTSV